jgi:CheY-like chemotaxis protein
MDIMIVDPSELSRNVIEDLLMKMGVPGVSIHLFVDGEHALEHVRENSVDLVFTSLSLAEVDGIDLIDIMLREDPEIASKLFVLSSSDKEAFDDVKGIGAKRFIKKPINRDYFIHFIQPEVEKLLFDT